MVGRQPGGTSLTYTHRCEPGLGCPPRSAGRPGQTEDTNKSALLFLLLPPPLSTSLLPVHVRPDSPRLCAGRRPPGAGVLVVWDKSRPEKPSPHSPEMWLERPQQELLCACMAAWSQSSSTCTHLRRTFPNRGVRNGPRSWQATFTLRQQALRSHLLKIRRETRQSGKEPFIQWDPNLHPIFRSTDFKTRRTVLEVRSGLPSNGASAQAQL